MMREQFDNWFLLLLLINMILQKEKSERPLREKNDIGPSPILRVENNFVHTCCGS